MYTPKKHVKNMAKILIYQRQIHLSFTHLAKQISLSFMNSIVCNSYKSYKWNPNNL